MSRSDSCESRPNPIRPALLGPVRPLGRCVDSLISTRRKLVCSFPRPAASLTHGDYSRHPRESCPRKAYVGSCHYCSYVM